MSGLSGISRTALFAGLFALVAIAAWALTIAFVFPGWFDPFWTYHSDAYISLANANSPAGIFDAATDPRPVVGVVTTLMAMLGHQGLFVALNVVLLGNVLLTAAVARTVFKDADLLLFAIAFGLYAFLIVLHPAQYVFATYDGAALICYFFLAIGLLAMITGRHLAIVWGACLLAFLSKETYHLSALILFGAYALDQRTVRGWLGLGGVIAAMAVTLAVGFLQRSMFISGGDDSAPYHVDLNPLSILDLLGRMISYGFNLAHLALLVLVVLGVVSGGINRLRLLMAVGVFVVAGLSSLLPYALLPNHFDAGYSFEASYFLFAPVFALACISPAVLRYVAIGLAALATGIQPVLAGPKYEMGRWSVEQQQRQARMWRALSAAAGDISPDATRILVIGTNFPFKPFDHSRALFALNIPRKLQFDVVKYGSEQDESHRARIAHLVTADQTQRNHYDRVWVFALTGDLILNFDPAADGVEIPLSEMAKYPALATVYPTGRAANWYDYMQCGNVLLDAGAFEPAEACLRTSIRTSGDNPYPHFYLGNALEKLGRLSEGRQAYAQAVAFEATSPNPAFKAALDALDAKIAGATP